jgi:hypothetical protein
VYKVTVITHFEDWYVTEDDIDEFLNFHDAVKCFMNKGREGFEKEFLEIQNFIKNCDFVDEDDLSDYGMGVSILIYRDEEEIVFIHKDYNPESQSLKNVDLENETEYYHELLTEKESIVLKEFRLI